MLKVQLKEKDAKEDEVARLQEELKGLKDKMKEKDEKKDEREKVKKNEVDVFANKKGFINLPNYNGKAEAYDDWHFKSVTFLEVEDEFKSLLEFTENLTKEPTEEKLK